MRSSQASDLSRPVAVETVHEVTCRRADARRESTSARVRTDGSYFISTYVPGALPIGM